MIRVPSNGNEEEEVRVVTINFTLMTNCKFISGNLWYIATTIVLY